MPRWLEDRLKKEGKKKKLSGRNLAAYVYGTMAKLKKKNPKL